MRSFLAAIVLVGLNTASCGDSPKSANDTTVATTAPAAAPARNPSSLLDKQGTAELMELLGAYYELKDAMVAADTSRANTAGSRVLSAGETMNNTLKANPQGEKLRSYVETIMTQSEAITGDKQNNIELKRASFEQVSDAMYMLVKEAKLANAGVYHQYCPMAFNDKGAYWLSNEAEIKNPYFGKKMLECGEVKDSL